MAENETAAVILLIQQGPDQILQLRCILGVGHQQQLKEAVIQNDLLPLQLQNRSGRLVKMISAELPNAHFFPLIGSHLRICWISASQNAQE